VHVRDANNPRLELFENESGGKYEAVREELSRIPRAIPNSLVLGEGEKHVDAVDRFLVLTDRFGVVGVERPV